MPDITRQAENPVWGLRDAFAFANSLHTNFYEDWLTEEFVLDAVGRVRDFVTKLTGLL